MTKIKEGERMAEEEKEMERFAALAKAAAPAQIDALFSKKEEIVKLGFADLEKMSTLAESLAANNGICGLGCAAARRMIPEVR